MKSLSRIFPSRTGIPTLHIYITSLWDIWFYCTGELGFALFFPILIFMLSADYEYSLYVVFWCSAKIAKPHTA